MATSIPDDDNEVSVNLQSSSQRLNLGKAGSFNSRMGSMFRLGEKESARFVNLTENYIPIQEATLLLYRVKRRQVLSDGRRFALLFFSFLICAFMVYSPNTTWEQTTSVMDMFLDEEFPSSDIYKNFFSVATHEELWEYTEEVFVPQLFAERQWYSGRPFTEAEYGYTMNDHSIVGGAQIRLNKVEPRKCAIAGSLSGRCRERFTTESEDKTPFNGEPTTIGGGGYNVLIPGSIQLKSGSNLIVLMRNATEISPSIALYPVGDVPVLVDISAPATEAELVSAGYDPSTVGSAFTMPTPWTGSNTTAVGWSFGPYAYSTGLDRVKGRYGYGEWGDGTWYGFGGFVVTLDPLLSRSEALSVFQKLKSDTFTDSNTRVLQIEFNLNNFNTDMFTNVRLKFEHMESTKFLPSHQFATFRLDVYQNSVDRLRFVFEMIYIVALCYNVLYEIRLMFSFGIFRYFFTDLRNILSLFFLFLNGVAVYYWMYFLFDPKSQMLREQLETSIGTNEFISGFNAGYAWEHSFMMGGFVAICSCVHIFRLASLNERGRIMWKTFTRSLIDLILYFIILVAFLLAFAVAAMWIFGAELSEFHDISSSLSSVTRWCLGDFDYQALSRAAPKAAGPVFYLYSFIVFIFFLNIIVAVLVEAYETTTEEMEKDKAWMRQLPSLLFEVGYDTRNLIKQSFLNFVRAIACGKNNNKQDIDGDGVADVVSFGCFKNIQVSTEWEREAKLFYAMSRAYSRARVTSPGIDLFDYMLESFKTMEKEDAKIQSETGVLREKRCYFISRNEFRVLVGDFKIADRVFEAYSQLKTVTLINAAESRVHHAPPSYAEHLEDRGDDTESDEDKNNAQPEGDARGSFEVIKTNRNGNSAARIVMIDFESFDLRIYSMKWSQRRRIPMRDLMQIERSVIDRKRLKLVFTDEQSAMVTLKFKTPIACDDFERLAKAATQMAREVV